MSDEAFNTNQINETEVRQQVDNIIADIKNFCQAGAAVQGLKTACENFPIETRDESTKKAIVDVFVFLLQLIDRAQIANVLTVLDEEESTNLARYLYKIMEHGDKKACDNALAFHAALTTKFGVGIINRCLVPSIAKKTC